MRRSQHAVSHSAPILIKSCSSTKGRDEPTGRNEVEGCGGAIMDLAKRKSFSLCFIQKRHLEHGNTFEQRGGGGNFEKAEGHKAGGIEDMDETRKRLRERRSRTSRMNTNGRASVLLCYPRDLYTRASAISLLRKCGPQHLGSEGGAKAHGDLDSQCEV